MAHVTVTYWRDIPVLVTARDGADEATVPLSSRFQELVDAVAMQAGLSDSDAYLAEWRTDPGEERTGTAEAAANEAVAELEEQFGELRTRYSRPGGPFNATDVQS